MDLSSLTIAKTQKHLSEKDFSVRELAESYLASIKKRDGDIHAYIETYDDAVSQAEAVDEALKRGDKASALAGIPIAVKDNILIKGRIASAGSRMLKPYRATYDASVIERLRDAGVIFLGRTNMDEFAMGSSTESSYYGATKNPLDTTRVPGGSSGGSAAAVAMHGALVSLGSDTGGSIRQPAAFCGLVGLKPTYGAVSRFGLIAMASSLDQIGPIAKTVEDAELLFNTMAFHDTRDSTSAASQMKKQSAVQRNKKPIIGVPRDLMEGDGIDDDVRKNFEDSLQILKEEGYEVRDIALPYAPYALAVYYIIMPAEVSSNLARFDGLRYGFSEKGDTLLAGYVETRGVGFGAEARRRILLGSYVLSSGYVDAYYRKADIVRASITQDFARAFEAVDIIATPTTPSPAFKIGEKISNPLSMYLSDIFTVPANIAGIPALSVPSGSVVRDGVSLPLGMQFMAPHFGEQALFSAGKDFEKILSARM
ncbi:MAG: Asp-tRNA(Asn)/Glu-tRNA(Gln) amidotransferase subunit GatA [Parcubacteria group bacterium]|nr:Asp-tRNA(Asn)/Glu-tRNA(Gln) amidotransferase subunit GatA [Parcubacteria group bacterium]